MGILLSCIVFPLFIIAFYLIGSAPGILMHPEISISSLLHCVCECHLVVMPRYCLQKNTCREFQLQPPTDSLCHIADFQGLVPCDSSHRAMMCSTLIDVLSSCGPHLTNRTFTHMRSLSLPRTQESGSMMPQSHPARIQCRADWNGYIQSK